MKRRLALFLVAPAVLIAAGSCSPPVGGVTVSGTLSGGNWAIGGPASVVFSTSGLNLPWTGTAPAGSGFSYSVLHVPEAACTIVATFTQSTVTTAGTYTGSYYTPDGGTTQIPVTSEGPSGTGPPYSSYTVEMDNVMITGGMQIDILLWTNP